MAESGNKAAAVTSTLGEQGLCFDDETLKGKNYLKHSILGSVFFKLSYEPFSMLVPCLLKWKLIYEELSSLGSEQLKIFRPLNTASRKKNNHKGNSSLKFCKTFNDFENRMLLSQDYWEWLHPKRIHFATSETYSGLEILICRRHHRIVTRKNMAFVWNIGWGIWVQITTLV